MDGTFSTASSSCPPPAGSRVPNECESHSSGEEEQRKNASQSFAPYGRERNSNPFSAAACTSPKIPLAKRTSSCPPPAGSEALSAALVSIGRSRGRVDPNCRKRPSEAFSDSLRSVYPDDLPQRALAVHALVDAAHDAAHGGGDVLRPGDGHVHQRGAAVGERVVAVHV